jgi:hypothetical protein
VGEGESFLENKCVFLKYSKRGLYQSVRIKCKDDEKTKVFSLVLSPKIKMNVDGKEEEYNIGDFIFEGIDENTGKKNYAYLGYVGSSDFSTNIESLYAVIFYSPYNYGSKLEDEELDEITRIIKSATPNIETGFNLLILWQRELLKVLHI